MSKYMNLIGKNAKKAIQNKINTKTKNKVLKKYIFLDLKIMAVVFFSKKAI